MLNNLQKVKNLGIVQARMGSTRLPGKVLKKIKGATLIEILLKRLSKSKQIDKIVVATTNNSEDEKLVDYVKSLGFETFCGDEDDVLNRYYQCAKSFNAQTIIRVTGDCPLIDPELVDDIIKHFYSSKVDYCSNTNPPTYPDGLDTEVFSFRALEKSRKFAQTLHHKEHVTPILKSDKRFSRKNFTNKENMSKKRWTVDEIDDFNVVKEILNYFSPNYDFSWKEIIELEKIKPEIFHLNKSIVRDEGARIGSGQKLWKRAKKIIPGGNMLLSKRAEMFLPEIWPAYFQRSKGYKVWDMDGNEFNDMSIMGIGTNILGYGNQEIDEYVRETISKGNMSTLNCPEEVYLAEKLIELHTGVDYRVYMIGFSPGFPYLGGMNYKLVCPRVKKPRINVPAGSVGIAEQQTGIYPIDSPGGWQIIGKTFLNLFDLSNKNPSYISPGNIIRFRED